MAALGFIINILSTPAILVGLLALLGLCLQGKPVEDVIKGTPDESSGVTKRRLSVTNWQDSAKDRKSVV